MAVVGVGGRTSRQQLFKPKPEDDVVKRSNISNLARLQGHCRRLRLNALAFVQI